MRYAPYISIQLQADRPFTDISYIVDEGGTLRVIPVGEDGIFPDGRCIYSTYDFTDIWQASITNVIATGTGTVRFNGAGNVRSVSNWTVMQRGIDAEAIYGDSLSNVYAVGSIFTIPPARIWYYDGNAENSWSFLQPTETDLHDVWVSGDLVVAVGDGIYMK